MNNDNKAAPEGILWVLSLRERSNSERELERFRDGR